MTVRPFRRLALAACAAVLPLTAFAQATTAPAPKSTSATSRAASPAAKYPERAVRRDIPMTDMIERAFAAGTRDSSGRPGKNYWQIWNDYTINARFDAPTSTITGSETTVIHNNGPNEMTSIVMRLDQNVYSANVPRSEVMTDITDGIKLTKLEVDGEAVDLSGRGGGRGRGGAGGGGRGGRGGFGRGAADTAAQGAPPPSTVSGLATTSARISLGKPVPAHGTATLTIDWSFQVPRVIAPMRGMRMGRWGDTLYQVAQWYPRVAVFDDVRSGGWDTEPYLGSSEFYNNLGHWDVHLDMPAGWIVGSTGILQNPQEVLTQTERDRLARAMDSDSIVHIVTADERGPGKSTAAGDRLIWHFVADTAGDVAWATSNQFLWDAARAEIPTKRPIPVNVMYLPGHAVQYANAIPTVQHALKFYSNLWIPYAFPIMTMVDGPENGMEYPMFIMSSVGAADHETGHSWWPMTVNTNETWYPFMDEGFNQYMNILSAADRNHQPPNLNGQGQAWGRTSGNETEATLMWDANYGGPQYQNQGYSRAPQMLSMLGGVVGDSAVWHAMSQYAQAWRFKHPTPWDYAFFMNNALHQDLGWFWYSWLFTTDAVDESIQSVSKVGTHTTVTVRQDGQMPSPVVLKVAFAPKGAPIKQMANSKALDSATALVTYPVDVWFAGSRTFKADLSFGGRTIDKITLDPYCRFPNRTAVDNVWPRDTTAAADAGRGRGARGGGGGGGGGGRGGGCPG